MADYIKNIEIRNLIRKNRLFNYEVAAKIGISEYTFARWLRFELDENKKARTLNAIKELIGKEE